MWRIWGFKKIKRSLQQACVSHVSLSFIILCCIATTCRCQHACRKNIHDHFCSTGSLRGLQPRYSFLCGPPRTDLPIFCPQTAWLHLCTNTFIHFLNLFCSPSGHGAAGACPRVDFSFLRSAPDFWRVSSCCSAATSLINLFSYKSSHPGILRCCFPNFWPKNKFWLINI